MSIRTARDGQPTGVWELAALQAAVERGEVQPTDLVWTKGFKDWKKLSEVASEIGISLQNGPPPIPGSAPPPIPKKEKDDGIDMSSVVFSDADKKPEAKANNGCLVIILFCIAAVMVLGMLGQIGKFITTITGTQSANSYVGSQFTDSYATIEGLFQPLSKHVQVKNCRPGDRGLGTDCTFHFKCGEGLGKTFGLYIDMHDFEIVQYRNGVRLSEELKMIVNLREGEPTDVHIYGTIDKSADAMQLYFKGQEVKAGEILFDPSNPFYKGNICPL